MKKTNIARMVWPEVQEAVERKAVVMVPLASIEPSGRHAVMGGEQFIAEYFVEGVAQRTDAIWLPTMPFGYAPSFMGFPGTINMQPSTLAAVLEDVCNSLLHHGFEHILIVDNHSGNEPIIEQVARKFRQETGVILANLLLPPLMRAVSDDLYDDLAAVHGHGGEPGVSTRLYLCPDDMRLDLAVETEFKKFQGHEILGTRVTGGVAQWQLFIDYDEMTESGGSGVPFNADAEKGKIILDRMVEHGVEVVNTFRSISTRVEG